MSACMGRSGAALAALLACSGCVSPEGGAIKAGFDAKAMEAALRPGTSAIDGEAFLRRDYGRLVSAAGERVYLIPATPYTVERFGRMFGGEMRTYYGNAVDPPPDEYLRYRRETKADMFGRFTFRDLSPGRYIVATRVYWTQPQSFFTHGGAIYDIVEVKKDDVAKAIISGK